LCTAKRLHRLEFNEHPTINDKIRPALADSTATILDGNRRLTSEGNSPRLQLDRQRFLVEAFETTRTELAMHFQRRADHLLRERVKFGAPFVPSRARN
jgi:hypothetical protein